LGAPSCVFLTAVFKPAVINTFRNAIAQMIHPAS
jgi:hypothetical protein